MPRKKKAKTFSEAIRFSEDSRQLLELLSENMLVSKNKVIELAVLKASTGKPLTQNPLPKKSTWLEELEAERKKLQAEQPPRKPKIIRKVTVNHKYVYETDLDVEVGTKVILPSASWLRDVLGNTWIGVVTSLNGDYSGYCSRIIGISSED